MRINHPRFVKYGEELKKENATWLDQREKHQY